MFTVFCFLQVYLYTRYIPFRFPNVSRDLLACCEIPSNLKASWDVNLLHVCTNHSQVQRSSTVQITQRQLLLGNCRASCCVLLHCSCGYHILTPCVETTGTVIFGVLAFNYNLRLVRNFINMDKIRIADLTPEPKQEGAEWWECTTTPMHHCLI